MRKRSRKPGRKSAAKKPRRTEPDVNQVAHWIATRTTGTAPAPTKNPHAVALGILGGKKGGLARKAALTPEQRSEIASKAARTRWKTGQTMPDP